MRPRHWHKKQKVRLILLKHHVFSVESRSIKKCCCWKKPFCVLWSVIFSMCSDRFPLVWLVSIGVNCWNPEMRNAHHVQVMWADSPVQILNTIIAVSEYYSGVYKWFSVYYRCLVPGEDETRYLSFWHRFPCAAVFSLFWKSFKSSSSSTNLMWLICRAMVLRMEDIHGFIL